MKMATYDMNVDGAPLRGWQALADDYQNVLAFFFEDKYTLGKRVEKDGQKGFEIVDRDGNVHGWMTQTKDNGCLMTWNPDRIKEVA